MCESFNNINCEGVLPLFHPFTHSDSVQSSPPLPWEVDADDFDLPLHSPFWNSIDHDCLDLPLLTALVDDTSDQDPPIWESVNYEGLNQLLGLSVIDTTLFQRTLAQAEAELDLHSHSSSLRETTLAEHTISRELDEHEDITSNNREEQEVADSLTHFKKGAIDEDQIPSRGKDALPGDMRKREFLGTKSDVHPYADYLVQRVQGDWPNRVSSLKLFEEIKDKGYVGSIYALRKALKAIREDQICSPEILSFHKDYLIGRVRELSFFNASTHQLFEEIKSRGYRGSMGNLHRLLTQIRREKCPKGMLEFHRDYLLKRLKEIQPDHTLASKLFQEIRGRGYQETVGKLKRFLTIMQKRQGASKTGAHCNQDGVVDQEIRKEMQSHNDRATAALSQGIEANGEKQGGSDSIAGQVDMASSWMSPVFLNFHKRYLVERMKEMEYPSASTLFREIQAKGYRGSLRNLQKFVTTMRHMEPTSRDRFLSAECLDFHKEYLAQQIKGRAPDCVSASELFREIKKRGYQMGLRNVQQFVAELRKKYGLEKKSVPPEGSIGFHRNYLVEQLTQNGHHSPSTFEMFKEVQKRGYQGTLLSFRKGITRIRKKIIPPQAVLKFHKDYLRQRVEETRLSPLSGFTLFKEIQSRGYRGQIKNVQAFLTRMRKGKK